MLVEEKAEPEADIDIFQLSKYPILNDFEKQTSVPKVYAALGLVAVYFFLIFFNIGGEFLVNIAGFVIPGYYSLNALFTSQKADDTQVSSFLLSAIFAGRLALQNIWLLGTNANG